MRQTKLLACLAWVIKGMLLSLGPVYAALTLPDVPLGVATSAKPMTLIVAGKDHKLFYEAYNDASDINGDGVLDIRFNPNITYYGLFDSNLCYTYSGSGNSGLFSPSSYATNGKCPGKWSGNWLNYVTTSRIDALRKVLYGGYREVDTANQTILRRAYIPQDAHSWAKEYTSEAVDGYKISDYTPLAQPESGKRHFFGNLTANERTNCATLSNCSNLPPLLSVVINSSKRVWEWASKERPVLDDSHGGTRTDYTVRVEVCTSNFHNGCKQYPYGNYKPIGLLHEYGENDAMLFGLLTGSYNKNMSGGVLRKVVSSFKNEVDAKTGQFTNVNGIVRSFDSLRIRDFNNGRIDAHYRNGSLRTRIMHEGEYVDWGNPIAEMMYEGVRYFAGKGSPTPAFATSGSHDSAVGLPVASWDNPYHETSAAKAPWCAKANMLVVSDVNPSYDSDQLPGSYFNNFSGDLAGLNVQTLLATITNSESGVTGYHFIGQSEGTFDSAPTPKNVTSLGTIRGLPEEPNKQGSYYSAAIAFYGKTQDLSSANNKQTMDSFYVSLASPLPIISVPVGGKTITLIPFAKTVDGIEGGSNDTDRTKGKYQVTDPIVDFYFEEIVNTDASNVNPSVNGGRPYMKFRINFEADEQGNDFDMDVVAQYIVQVEANNTLTVKVKVIYQSTGSNQNVGYIISGSNRDGIYLVAQDKDEELHYFLNVPPGRDPGYCDVPSPPADCAKLPYLGATPPSDESVQYFSAGTSSATMLKDPLWYAAKWGGFIDKNGNNIPDLPYEWDADGNGVPDTYFLVQNPLRLKESLKRALDNIIERSASAGNVTSNSTSITSTTQVFQSIFNTANWSGDLHAYPITSSGVRATPNWKASEQIPAPAARKIFITGSNGRTVSFQWSSLIDADQTAIGSDDVLNYLRGDRSKELQNGGGFRNRAASNVLGDIVHSSPFYVKDTNTVYVGANDGMLHAFNATTGAELFAYIPSALIPKLKDLTKPTYNHTYYVDGDIAVSSRDQTPGKNYLVATMGRGGKGLFALDVSNPSAFSEGNFLWQYFNSLDNDLGYMLGKPVLAKMNNGSFAVILGNGYNSNTGKAVLYIFDLTAGNLIKKIDTGVAGDNGLASPGVVDANGDGKVDYIYAGDLKGNVWKFDVSDSDANQWKSAFMSGPTPEPFFVAKGPSGNPQPITAQITSAVNNTFGDPNYGKRFIFFGTGSYFTTDDPANTQTQSWYGLIDNGSKIADRSALKVRSGIAQGSFNGKTVRVFPAATAGDMADKKGWVLDFTTPQGERIVTSSKYYKLAAPTLIASSIIPVVDPCVPGGNGFVNAIDPFSGGRLSVAVFDVNDNKNFGDDKLGNDLIGGVDLGVGMPSEPTLVGDRLVVGGSKGEVKDIRINPGARLKGRISWREIVKE
jgi:type IV pilus assembly protein PilY1